MEPGDSTAKRFYSEIKDDKGNQQSTSIANTAGKDKKHQIPRKKFIYQIFIYQELRPWLKHRGAALDEHMDIYPSEENIPLALVIKWNMT